MSEASSGDDKTEEPTPKKLSDARNKGNVAKSKELATFIVFLGFSIAVFFVGENSFHVLLGLFRRYFSLEIGLVEDKQEFLLMLADFGGSLFSILGPLFAAVTVFGIAAYLMQFGFLLTTDPLVPKFNKLNPLSGLKRIFSRDTAVELIKSLIKLAILSAIIWFLFKGEVATMLQISGESVAGIFLYFMMLVGKMGFAVLIFMLVLGVIDFSYQKWSFNEKQKMTMKEVKDENKNREGDPHVKARIRQIQREVARARMMDNVKEADVVVANPTHVAVALKYSRGKMDAPMVVAKGAGYIALKIKELAVRHQIPVMEKRDLARYLYRNVEINQYIPEKLFSAVAEVLAYVYRMKRKYAFLGGMPESVLRGEART